MRIRFHLGPAPLLLVLARVAAAHPSPNAAPLHVDDSYQSCFFDLHPELTQAEFDEFAGEAGAIARFHQLAEARTIGRGSVDVSLQYSRTPIDDAKGAWNNTMSHPRADHYLGHDVSFPRLVVRVGVGDRVDVGAWGSLNPQSNYGFLGVESKIALRRDGDGAPVALALRPNASLLLGPAEMWAGNAGLDLSVSRSFRGLAPYLGVGGSVAFAVERSKDVALDPGRAASVLAFGGLAYTWKALSVAAQGEVGTLATLALRAGGRF